MLRKLTEVMKGMLLPNFSRKRHAQTKKSEPKIKVTDDHNLVLGTFKITDYVGVKKHDQLINNFALEQEGMSLSGTNDGSLGIPSADSTAPSPSEFETTSKARSLIEQVVTEVERELIPKREQAMSLTQSLNAATTEERIEAYIFQKAHRKNWFFNVFRKSQDQQTLKERTEHIANKIKKTADILTDQLKRVYHQQKPNKGVLDYTPIYCLFLFFIGMGEYPLNVQGLQNLGDLSNLFVLNLSAFFAIIIGYCAHAAGHAFFKGHKGEWVAALGMGLSLCLIISVLRSRLDGSLVMSLMNILIFLFGCFIAFIRAKNYTYWNHQRRKKTLEKRKLKLERLTRKLKNRYRAEAIQAVREQEGELRTLINVTYSEIATVEAYLENCESRINAIATKAIAAYRHANTVSRIQAGIPPVQSWEGSNVSHRGKAKNRKHRFYSNVKAIIGLLCFSLFFGCTPSSNVSDAVVLFDTTDPVSLQDIKKDQITPYLLEEVLDLNAGDLQSQGVNVTVSSIGTTSVQYRETAFLEPGGSFLLRTEKAREEEVKSFKALVNAQIQTIARPKKDAGRTVLMQNLCEHLNTLAASNARKKVLLIFSDLLENSQHCNFYHYRNRPSQILDHYKTIATKMDKVCPLPSLDNIVCTIIYLPDEETDQLFLAAKTFWTKYLTDYGATVVFKPNI